MALGQRLSARQAIGSGRLGGRRRCRQRADEVGEPAQVVIGQIARDRRHHDVLATDDPVARAPRAWLAEQAR
jgi:hypothetical protein